MLGTRKPYEERLHFSHKKLNLLYLETVSDAKIELVSSAILILFVIIL